MDLMTLYNRQVTWLKKVKEYQEKGIQLYVPFPKRYGRLKTFYPGLMKGENIIITANSGIGKSKFIKDFFINIPIEYALRQKGKIKLKIFFNNLEDSDSQVVTGFISKEIYKQSQHTKIRTYFELNGYKGDITEGLLKEIEDTKDYIEKISPFVEFINIKNPYGIYQEIRAYMAKNGKFFTVKKVGKEEIKEKEVFPYTIINDEVIWNKEVRWHIFEYNDPSLFVILVNDRLGKMSTEKGKTKYETILHWTDTYCGDLLCNKFGVIVANVQQQSSDKERIETNFKGKTIEQKLEPSLDGLANVKQTQQAATLVIGIFAPVRYKIEEHAKDEKGQFYDIRILKDYYRSWHLLKTRNGVGVGSIFPMFFNGAIDRYQDMPKLGSEELNKLYEYVKKVL